MEDISKYVIILDKGKYMFKTIDLRQYEKLFIVRI